MNSASLYSTRIIGTGSAFPQKRMTNSEVVAILAQHGQETSDEWIQQRTGIRERRIADPKNPAEYCSSLATQAAQRALEMAGKKASDLDFILFSTCTPDRPLPSAACYVQANLKAERAWALDVNAACSGFVYAMALADGFIASGQAKTGLVIGAEVLSSIINWKDRGSCILFGDGAGAAIVERVPRSQPERIYSSHLRSAGELTEILFVPSGGSRPPTPEDLARGAKMEMNGREIFKVAVKTLADLGEEALKANGLSVKDLDWFVPHQANMRILESVADRLKLPLDRTVVTLDRYGNTSSATVPTALDEAIRDGRIKKGQTVLLDVFGAGVTSGSILLKL